MAPIRKSYIFLGGHKKFSSEVGLMFPVWLQAGFWGLVGDSALLLGGAVGYFVSIPQRAIATIMAFGAGVLI